MRVVVSGLVVVGLTLGCSGGDEVATTVPTAPSTVAEVSATTATTTRPTPTTLPASTVSPPSSVVTIPFTVPPLSTTPTLPPGDPATDVVAFVQEHFRLYNEARLDPTNDATVAAAAATMTGGALSKFQEIIADYRARGVRELSLDQLPARIDVDPSSLAMDGVNATIEVCWLNSNLLIKPAGNPDGTDEIVDPSVSASSQRYYLSFASGAWLVESLENLATFEGELTCSDT
jgi:hypothetical protein